MHGINNIITVYIAPRDLYTYKIVKQFHTNFVKRKFAYLNVYTPEENRLIENNKRSMINYSRPIRISNSKSTRVERYHIDNMPIPFSNFHSLFSNLDAGWFGIPASFYDDSKLPKRTMNIPETSMFYGANCFKRNTLFENLYSKNLSFDEALRNATMHQIGYKDLISSLRKAYRKEKMPEKLIDGTIAKKLISYANTVTYNRNSPGKNKYNFLMKYYNAYVDTKLREMAKIEINFYFLKELLKNHTNLNLFVLGLDNNLSRIVGMVQKRTENVVVSLINKKTYDDSYRTYSFSKDHLIFNNRKEWVTASKLKKNYKDSVYSHKLGVTPTYVDHRYSSENLYELILMGHKPMTYFDPLGMLHVGYSYDTLNQITDVSIIA